LERPVEEERGREEKGREAVRERGRLDVRGFEWGKRETSI